MATVSVSGHPVAAPEPLGRSHIRATHVPYDGDKRKSIVFPNTYYDIPKHRYPYYDAYGRGRNLYGYGGPTLYKYSVFRAQCYKTFTSVINECS